MNVLNKDEYILLQRERTKIYFYITTRIINHIKVQTNHHCMATRVFFRLKKGRQYLLVSLRNADVGCTLSSLLSFALNLGIISNVLHISSILTQIASENVGWELAGSISDSSGTSKVGVRGSQTLLVMELSIGLGLCQEILHQISVGWHGISDQKSSDSSGSNSLLLGCHGRDRGSLGSSVALGNHSQSLWSTANNNSIHIVNLILAMMNEIVSEQNKTTRKCHAPNESRGRSSDESHC